MPATNFLSSLWVSRCNASPGVSHSSFFISFEGVKRHASAASIFQKKTTFGALP
jgi:hypothetical protein